MDPATAKGSYLRLHIFCRCSEFERKCLVKNEQQAVHFENQGTARIANTPTEEYSNIETKHRFRDNELRRQPNLHLWPSWFHWQINSIQRANSQNPKCHKTQEFHLLQRCSNMVEAGPNEDNIQISRVQLQRRYFLWVIVGWQPEFKPAATTNSLHSIRREFEGLSYHWRAIGNHEWYLPFEHGIHELR